MNQPNGEDPGADPTIRFGEPYPGAPQEPYGGRQGYGPQYEQPQYGQHQYGQPQYGQPQGSPPPYGQPQYGQPQYGQPPYGQPGYGQAGRYSAVAGAYGAPVGSGAQFGVVGVTLAGIGAILLIIALTAVEWVRRGGTGASFSDVGSAVSDSQVAAGLAGLYYSWLAWLLVVLVVAIAVAANLPTPASGPLRALGAIGAAAAVAVTFFAIRLFTTGTYWDYLKHMSVGFYLAVVGFIVTGIGAMIGPKRN